jgi:hypothetical protein
MPLPQGHRRPINQRNCTPKSTHTDRRQSHHLTWQPSRRQRPPAAKYRLVGQEAAVQLLIKTVTIPLGTAIVDPGQICLEEIVELFTDLGSSPSSKCHCRHRPTLNGDVRGCIHRNGQQAHTDLRAQRLPRVPANRRRPARTSGHRPPDKTCSRSLSTVRPNHPEATRGIAAEAVGWTLSTVTCRRSPPPFRNAV